MSEDCAATATTPTATATHIADDKRDKGVASCRGRKEINWTRLRDVAGTFGIEELVTACETAQNN